MIDIEAMPYLADIPRVQAQRHRGCRGESFGSSWGDAGAAPRHVRLRSCEGSSGTRGMQSGDGA
jgi:hypothetical protein